jgi:hypothetical protein
MGETPAQGRQAAGGPELTRVNFPFRQASNPAAVEGAVIPDHAIDLNVTILTNAGFDDGRIGGTEQPHAADE